MNNNKRSRSSPPHHPKILKQSHQQSPHQHSDPQSAGQNLPFEVLRRVDAKALGADKKIKQSDPQSAVLTDQNLLFEVLRHVDAKTLGAAACVSSHWHRTVQDERLWELICTKHWENIGCGSSTLRLVVLALGGFRCLHSHYLLPLSKPSISVASSSSSSTVAAATSTSASASAWPCLPPTRSVVKTTAVSAPRTRWGKDEIQLSLSLLSIRYFEKLNFDNRKK